MRDIPDPLARIEKVIENNLQNYLGAGVFEGGCLLCNALMELAGQSPEMSAYVLSGFKSFAKLLHRWLNEADQQGLLKAGLNLEEIAHFIVTSLNGAAPMYAASQDPAVWRHTLSQLNFYLESLKKPHNLS